MDITDPTVFEDIRERADNIISSHAQRDANLKKLDDVYLLRWPEKPKNPDIKLTMSPDGRNSVRGVVNLMTATEPQFTVPADENDTDAKAHSEEMEQGMQALLSASNAVQMVQIERELAHSMTLYDEGYVTITCMADLVEAIKTKDKRGWMDASILEAAEDTPYLFECIPPRCSYPLIGRTGLLAFVQRRNLTVAEVLERFGSLAAEHVKGKKTTDAIEVREYWDAAHHVVWLYGAKAKPLIVTENRLGFIPAAVSFGSGTRLYDEPENQRQPFLMGIIKSELWQRKNAVLTAAFHRLMALGLNVTFIHEQGSADAEVEIDYSQLAGVVNVPPGGKLRLAADNLLDPNILNALQITDRMIEESTVFKQALGAPLSGVDTFSTISLLSQSGRLPLTPVQEGVKKVLSRTAQLTMKWIKKDGKAASVYRQNKKLSIDPLKIPDRVVFDVILDVSLPQDMLRNANIAQMLKESGLVDDRWIHENILNVGQTVDMQRRVLAQRIAEALSAYTAKTYIDAATKPPPQPGQGQPQGGPGVQGGLPPEQAGELPMNEQPQGMPGEMGLPV